MRLSISIMDIPEFLEEFEDLLREYALQPGANEIGFASLRTDGLGDAAGRFNPAQTRSIRLSVPASLRDARSRWYREPAVA